VLQVLSTFSSLGEKAVCEDLAATALAGGTTGPRRGQLEPGEGEDGKDRATLGEMEYSLKSG
jgi:hypothetical protein